MVSDEYCLQWGRSPGKTGSHFDPNSDLFVPSERKDVITSTVCWSAMAALLVGLSFVMGSIQMLKLYGVPYWVNYIFSPYIFLDLRKLNSFFFVFPNYVICFYIDFGSLLMSDFCYVAGFCDLSASPWS